MKRRANSIVYSLVALFLVIAAILVIGSQQKPGFSSNSTAAQGSSSTPHPLDATATPSTDPIYRLFLVDGFTVPLAQICQSRDQSFPTLILDATTSSQPLPGHWNTPDKQRPADLVPTDLAPNSIVTPLKFSSVNIVVDNRKAETEELVTLGGIAGKDQIEVSGEIYPSLRPQQQYLLFFFYGKSERQLVVTSAFRIVGTDMRCKDIARGWNGQRSVEMA